MQATRMIMQGIRSGTAIEDGIYVSNPVIRYIDEKPNIAVFLIDNIKKKGKRPECYVTADIDNGENMQLHNCREEEFSSASYDKIYDGETSLQGNVSELSEAFLDEIYDMFDGIRQSLIEKVPVEKCIERYEKYMSRMLTSVPVSYKIFYKELSNLGKEKSVEEAEHDETPAKKYMINNVRWSPKKNLSKLPEAIYRMGEKIAEHIQFLPSDVPFVIRYEYPAFCMEKDRKINCDPWQELLIRLRNDPPKLRHYQAAAKKKSVFTTCDSVK